MVPSAPFHRNSYDSYVGEEQGARHKNGARGFSSESRGKSPVLGTSIRAFPNVSTVSCGLRTVRGTGRYPDLLGFLDVAMPEWFKTQVYVVHPEEQRVRPADLQDGAGKCVQSLPHSTAQIEAHQSGVALFPHSYMNLRFSQYYETGLCTLVKSSCRIGLIYLKLRPTLRKRLLCRLTR